MSIRRRTPTFVLAGGGNAALAVLSASDHAFLDALRRGQTAREYAREHNYSPDWAKWKSRVIREKCGGLKTIAEVLAMSEVTAEDIRAIRKELADLKEAQADLAKAKTPAAKEAAREDVRDAQADLDAELRSRGLSRSDLDKLQEDKEYEKFKAREERLRSEREAEAEAAKGAKPKPKTPAKKDDPVDDEPAPAEEPPQSQHWADRKLWGRKDDAA